MALAFGSEVQLPPPSIVLYAANALLFGAIFVYSVNGEVVTIVRLILTTVVPSVMPVSLFAQPVEVCRHTPIAKLPLAPVTPA